MNGLLTVRESVELVLLVAPAQEVQERQEGQGDLEGSFDRIREGNLTGPL